MAKETARLGDRTTTGGTLAFTPAGSVKVNNQPIVVHSSQSVGEPFPQPVRTVKNPGGRVFAAGKLVAGVGDALTGKSQIKTGSPNVIIGS